MILQLNPSIPVITPKGKAIAHAIIDSGIEHDLLWICFQDSNGECWTWKNTQVRAQINITQGRDFISPFYNPSEVGFSKDEEVQNEEIDEECEEGSEEEEYDYEIMYNEKCQDFVEQKEKLIKFREENKITKQRINKISDLLSSLYNDDQIHDSKIELVRTFLIENYDFVDGFYGRITRKN